MTLEEIIYQAAADGLVSEWQADELVARINTAAKNEVHVAMGARCFTQEPDGYWHLGKFARSREDGTLFRIGGITLALLLFAGMLFGQSAPDLLPDYFGNDSHDTMVYHSTSYFHLRYDADQAPSIMLKPSPARKQRMSIFPVEYHYTHRRDIVLDATSAGLAIISGMAYGVREVVTHRPHRIPAHWNQQWWDPRLSWTNKYHDNDPTHGRRMVPVSFTDAYHLSGTVHRWTLAGSALCIGLHRNNNWKQIGMSALFNSVLFQMGFLSVWKTDLIFN